MIVTGMLGLTLWTLTLTPQLINTMQSCEVREHFRAHTCVVHGCLYPIAFRWLEVPSRWPVNGYCGPQVGQNELVAVSTGAE